MRLLIVQLSDMHFQAAGNPIMQRLVQLEAAILALHPYPKACLVLVTGDVANSGESEEYLQAALFFNSLRPRLEAVFGVTNVHFAFIPGNHDCSLPEDQVKVRETLVNASRPFLETKKPDQGYIDTLLSPQAAFTSFSSTITGSSLSGDDVIYRIQGLELGGKRIRLMEINTALLSQRHEKPGTLYLPPALLERPEPKQGDYDATFCMLHHPYNWFDPNFRHLLVRLIEDSAHVVFTGHEHQQDNHWSESSEGEETAYIEADALQDKSYPKTSGFNSLIIDFETSTQTYYHYKWKGDMYQPIINGKVHPISLKRKSTHRFQVSERFSPFLTDDDFGFTHPRKANLKLADFYAYPPLSVTSSTAEGGGNIVGSGVPAFLLNQTAVYITGQERAGKTALLKTFYRHLLISSRVPVYVKADDIPQDLDEALSTLIDKAVRAQYGDASVEPYRQLKRSRRAVMIDDLPRLRIKNKLRVRQLFDLLKAHFGLVLLTSTQLPDHSQFQAEGDEKEPLFSNIVAIRELPPSSRAEIIDKWFRLGLAESDNSETTVVREALRERTILSDLIRKRALPSLPYLIVGVLQIRQNKKEDLVDPGSFGYLFQRLVLDALSITRTKPHVDRKEGILRRFAFALYKAGVDGATKEVFDEAVAQYITDVQIKVDAPQIFSDLLDGKVLQEVDGFITFRHHYFFHYFVARQLLDGVDSDSPSESRAVLQSMADRPLLAANRLTLMFFLFFKKRDPIIDYLIDQAKRVLEFATQSDIASDARFVDDHEGVMRKATVNESINVQAADAEQLKSEDRSEERQLSSAVEVNELYSASLSPAVQLQFAYAHIELLGQVIRSFSGTLDGKKKQEILETVFRLGLRSIHVTLQSLAAFSQLFAEQKPQDSDPKPLEAMEVLFKRIVAFLARIHCDWAMLNMSRAVGVSDIEDSYEGALAAIGHTCATQLLELAIKLDHSDAFPFDLLRSTQLLVAKESKLAATVLSDLVVRHTQLIPMQKETLKRIASILSLDTKKLIEAAGK